MNREDLFYKELASCPELPSSEFDTICKKIDRKTVVKKLSIVGSITVMFLVTVLGVANFQGSGKKAIHPEVAAELQIIHDYLNGEDIGDQIETYAFFGEE